MRLNIHDDAITAAVKMADGNPGAATAMIELIKRNDEVDPDMGDGGAIIKLCWLDDWKIYGTGIWVLFKDRCDLNIARFIALLRGCQLGHVDSAGLQKMAIRGEPAAVDVDAIWRKVCEELPLFKKPEVASETKTRSHA